MSCSKKGLVIPAKDTRVPLVRTKVVLPKELVIDVTEEDTANQFEMLDIENKESQLEESMPDVKLYQQVR